ncbi:Crp/Fnr family transcriptional regulator [Pedobacter frigidisoli]|uniref:Crp/Fnr family transcriptional regulator n=1 Tax=Pedobacter frigidisoli TaxID=2530455 RepID=A0A4R0P2H2_9SPHI|nr:Crp/Fnr family transcriptional regulator [Pedobacter frigidisoli]TCD05924.1 Crp/Fnr family transcriptional regulator [Pedobacter frigidisoli]
MLPDFIIELIRLKLNKRIPEDFLQDLQKNAQLVEIDKGDILFSNQAKQNRTFVIVAGSLIRFVNTPGGEDRATMFYTETFFPIVGNNFAEIKASSLAYYIRANENTKLVEFKQDFAISCIEKYPSLAKMMFLNMVDYFQIHYLIQNHLVALTSIDFFQWLMEQYGFIFMRFQSQDIASFMGITPAWFSKLKRKANQK